MSYTFPYYFFFAIFGFVVGALVAWFFMAHHPFETLEAPGGPVDETESPLLVKMLADEGIDVNEALVDKVLELHGAYVEGRIGNYVAPEQAAPEIADVEQAEPEPAASETAVSEPSTARAPRARRASKAQPPEA